jgi:uncharacterized protein (TIGR03067 family)
VGSSSQLAGQGDDAQDSYIRESKIGVATTPLCLASQKSTLPITMNDFDRFQGTWYLVLAMQDGDTLPEDKVKQTTIVIKGDTFRFPESADYATSRAGTIKLDETKTPKQMDSISTDREVMLGIYALDDNGYKVCFAPAGKPRPTEFSSTPGSGYILQSWERRNKQ